MKATAERKAYLSEKARESRSARIRAGGERVDVVLHPDAAGKLRWLLRQYQVTKLELIEMLIDREAQAAGYEEPEPDKSTG